MLTIRCAEQRLEIVHAARVAHAHERRADKAERARDRAWVPGHLAAPARIEQILIGLGRLLLAHQRGVDAGREHIEQDRDPVAVAVLQVGRDFPRGRRSMRHNEARALERDHVGDAIENVGLHAGGLRLGQNLGGGRRLVGARILQLDARIGLLERVLQRPDRLVHDQGRVPDHLAFLFGGFDQGGVGSAGGFARQKREGNQHGERHTLHGHALPLLLLALVPRFRSS